jgi:hypothetical protein
MDAGLQRSQSYLACSRMATLQTGRHQVRLEPVDVEIS